MCCLRFGRSIWGRCLCNTQDTQGLSDLIPEDMKPGGCINIEFKYEKHATKVSQQLPLPPILKTSRHIDPVSI